MINHHDLTSDILVPSLECTIRVSIGVIDHKGRQKLAIDDPRIIGAILFAIQEFENLMMEKLPDEDTHSAQKEMLHLQGRIPEEEDTPDAHYGISELFGDSLDTDKSAE